MREKGVKGEIERERESGGRGGGVQQHRIQKDSHLQGIQTGTFRYRDTDRHISISLWWNIQGLVEDTVWLNTQDQDVKVFAVGIGTIRIDRPGCFVKMWGKQGRACR